MARSTLVLIAQIALLAAISPASAQNLDAGTAPLDGNAVDAVHRQRRIAVTGSLGFQPLPPITAESPRDSVFYADRLPFGAQPNGGVGGTISATITSTTVPKELTGTGFDEFIDFQLPDGYDGQGTPHPMVIAYHGFGGSAASVASLSTVDEEANTRNWVYLSVTGLDDQLFGSPISQQNTNAAIEFMLSSFNVDPDRLYLVGFSAGAAISANFAARHRDPEGVMIAALGLVSATGDWVMSYSLGDSALQTWMQNPFNFGGPPATELYAYQSASTMYNEQNSYPPVTSANPDALASMSTNLGSVPTYITYDDQDTITHVPVLCDEIEATLLAAGGIVQSTVVSGTVLPGPPSVPAPHSWEVLDEVALFDFFTGKSVDRVPSDFSAQQDVSATVSFASTVQDRNDQFTYIDASVDLGLQQITVSNMVNAKVLHLDVGEAGLTGAMPYRITVTNMSVGPTRLYLTGFPDSPSFLKDAGTGALVTLVDSAPSGGPSGNGTLILDVLGQTTLDANVIHDPKWTTILTTTPNPLVLGTDITFDIDGPAGDTSAFVIVSFSEVFLPLGSKVNITAFPLPPAILQLVPLDAAGDLSFSETVPMTVGLAGVRFAAQVVTAAPSGTLKSVSNLWGLYIAP